MTNLEIDSRDGRLWVRGSRDRRLGVFAAVLGAQRVGESWVFEVKHEKAIREFCRKLAGYEGMGTGTTPRPTLSPVQPEAAPQLVESSTLSLAQSLAAMLDPDLPVWQQLRHAHDATAVLDPSRADAMTLEEAAAAFESLAGRLRDLADRFSATSA